MILTRGKLKKKSTILSTAQTSFPKKICGVITRDYALLVKVAIKYPFIFVFFTIYHSPAKFITPKATFKPNFVAVFYLVFFLLAQLSCFLISLHAKIVFFLL